MNPLRSLFLSLSRMPPAVMLLLIIGLAVVVTFMVTGQMSEVEKKAAEEKAAMKAKYEATAHVVYTIKDIPEGATISADAVQEKDIPSSTVPPDALPSNALVVGRTAKFAIRTNQIVSSRDLQPIGQQVGFDAKVREGFRAVTFGVDANSGVAGFVVPGSHVDVYAAVGSDRGVKAAPILSDCEVIAVGTNYVRTSGAGAMPSPSVTVCVAPQDASRIIKTIQATGGRLYLTLRNANDHSPITVVDVSTLFPEAEMPSVAQQAPSLPPPPSAIPTPADTGGGGHQVEVWTGGHKDVIAVPQG